MPCFYTVDFIIYIGFVSSFTFFADWISNIPYFNGEQHHFFWDVDSIIYYFILLASSTY